MSSLKIEQIASLAQVSPATVSRVLNNYPHVRPAVRDRVLQVIREHNYAPHAAARSLASSRSNIIGLFIPRSANVIFSDPFFPKVIQGITEICNSLGYYLMLSMVSSKVEQNFYKNLLRGRHFDGTIALASDVDDPILPLLMKDRTPMVLVGNHPYFQDFATVDVDNREGVREVVNHLIGLGHRRIGMVTGPLQAMVSMERRDGYKQAILEAGLPLHNELIIEGDFTEEGGRAAMAQLLSRDPQPTAAFISSDTMAIGALRAIREAGLRVPEDIALASFDDMPIASYVNPTLTTVRQPMFELGATAAKLLVGMIEGGQPTISRTILPTTMIVRQSSGGVRSDIASDG